MTESGERFEESVRRDPHWMHAADFILRRNGDDYVDVGVSIAWRYWQAAFEAGREDVLKVNPASNSILDVVIYLEREELLTLIDACDIYVFSDKLNDVRSQLHRQLPAPPDSGDANKK